MRDKKLEKENGDLRSNSQVSYIKKVYEICFIFIIKNIFR